MHFFSISLRLLPTTGTTFGMTHGSLEVGRRGVSQQRLNKRQTLTNPLSNNAVQALLLAR